jgi:cyclomaltodextrinase
MHNFYSNFNRIRPASVPVASGNWLNEAVIYHILIDRFFRGGKGGHQQDGVDEGKPVFCGGNLQGIAEKLDYLLELGVNTIWLSPFNPTTAYHGYHLTDYFNVEKRFGGEDGFQKLVEAARSHHLRLIMDFVPNHVHVDHSWFTEARGNKKSRYRDWFYWRKNGDYLKYLDVMELPKLNLDHPEARDQMIRVAKHWLDRGIDGFRLDHALGPSISFWKEFRRAVKRHKADAVLIGEVAFWGIQRPNLATLRIPNKHFHFRAQLLGFDVLQATMREYAGVFDGLLDFYFQKVLELVAKSERRIPASLIQNMLDLHYAGFPAGCRLLSFLDNHDMDRFLFEAGSNRARLQQAAEIQFAQSSPPIIYYGTEAGMSQTNRINGDHGDLAARRMMSWDRRDSALFKMYQRLIREWKKSPY